MRAYDSPDPLTEGTYTTVVDETATISPSEAAPVTPRPARMLLKLKVLGMSSDIILRVCLSIAALKARVGVMAVVYRMSARQAWCVSGMYFNECTHNNATILGNLHDAK